MRVLLHLCFIYGYAKPAWSLSSNPIRSSKENESVFDTTYPLSALQWPSLPSSLIASLKSDPISSNGSNLQILLDFLRYSHSVAELTNFAVGLQADDGLNLLSEEAEYNANASHLYSRSDPQLHNGDTKRSIKINTTASDVSPTILTAYESGQVDQRLLWTMGKSGFYEVPFRVKANDFSPWIIDNMLYWAMRNIERGSNLRFRVANPDDKNYIVFVSGEGCLSVVGRHPSGGPQRISLRNPGCLYRHIVLHEILHALGLYHEHQRLDNYKFVEVKGDAPRMWKDWLASDPSIPIHITPYNLASIMHYTTFLKAKEERLQSVLDAKSPTLSSCDWHNLNVLYPGSKQPPACIPHRLPEACQPLPSCSYGETLCEYMCRLDCDIGLPRGDIKDWVASPQPFCEYIGGGLFPPVSL